MYGGIDSPLNLLRLHHALALLPINALLPLLQAIQRIHTGHNTEKQTRQPRPRRILLQLLRAVKLLETQRIHQRNRVQRQITRISELATDSQILQHGVRHATLAIECDRGGFDVFGELASAQDFACETKVFFEEVPRRDGRLRLVGAEEVPGVEPGKVLDCAEDFVAADYLLSC
jgi:hypothetical protein